MALSNKALNDKLREKYVEIFSKFIGDSEELLRTASNELCFPCVDEDGNEKFVTIKFSVPSGGRDGEGYDGYALAEEYAKKVAEKAEKAKVDAEKRERKIAKDKANREKLAKSKANHQTKA